MNQPPVFSETEFSLLEEALTDLKRTADRAANARVEIGEIMKSPRMGDFGNFMLGERLKQIAEEALKEQAQKAEGIILLQAKLIEYKRWQRQQPVQSETAAQA